MALYYVHKNEERGEVCLGNRQAFISQDSLLQNRSRLKWHSDLASKEYEFLV